MAAILEAILNISKCESVPAWHSLESWSTWSWGMKRMRTFAGYFLKGSMVAGGLMGAGKLLAGHLLVSAVHWLAHLAPLICACLYFLWSVWRHVMMYFVFSLIWATKGYTLWVFCFMYSGLVFDCVLTFFVSMSCAQIGLLSDELSVYGLIAGAMLAVLLMMFACLAMNVTALVHLEKGLAIPGLLHECYDVLGIWKVVRMWYNVPGLLLRLCWYEVLGNKEGVDVDLVDLVVSDRQA